MLNHQISAETQNVPQPSRSWFNLRNLFVLLFLLAVCAVFGLKIWFPKSLVDSIRDHGGEIQFTRNVHPVFDKMYGKIRSITITNSVDYPIDDNFIESLGEQSSLTELALGNAENPAAITDRGLVTLTKYPLQYLWITGGTISEPGWNALQQTTSLKGLSLRDFEISGVQLPSPASWKNLQALVLTGSNLTDQDLNKISLIPNIFHLDISNNRIEESGLRHLLNMKKLSSLCINDIEIQMNALDQLVSLKTLDSLSIQGKSINDAHVRQIANVKQLKTLLLNDSQVTDQGLVPLVNLKNLTELDLSNTQISDEALETLLKITKLNRLIVRDTKLSATTIDVLHDAGLEVVTSPRMY